MARHPTPVEAASPLNSYRVNAQLEGALSAPDLVPRNARPDLSGCSAAMRVLVEVTNLGAIGAPAGVPVAFYRVEGGVGGFPHAGRAAAWRQ